MYLFDNLCVRVLVFVPVFVPITLYVYLSQSVSVFIPLGLSMDFVPLILHVCPSVYGCCLSLSVNFVPLSLAVYLSQYVCLCICLY